MSDLQGRPGRLILAGTPIGDPDDASPRLREALASADVVAAEDTRRTRRLAADLVMRIDAPAVSATGSLGPSTSLRAKSRAAGEGATLS